MAALLTAAGLALLAAPPPVSGGDHSLEAEVALVEKGRETLREIQYTVIWFEPDEPVAVEVPAETFELAMVRKAFLPRVLTVPAGSRVAFPNNDGILHNAFSRSGRNDFDLGLYRKGESKDVVLRHPGVVQVFCNVHHSMVAHVIVLDTPFYTSPDRDGRFTLEGLPAGSGELVLWHERAEEKRIPITLPLDASGRAALDLRLETTKPRVPNHRNKFGKPYQRKRRGKAY